MIDNVITVISLLIVVVLTYLSGYKLGHSFGYTKGRKEQVNQPVKVRYIERQPVTLKVKRGFIHRELHNFPEQYKTEIIREAAEEIGREMFKAGLIKVKESYNSVLNSDELELTSMAYPPIDD